jgi:hypothetical protein
MCTPFSYVSAIAWKPPEIVIQHTFVRFLSSAFGHPSATIMVLLAQAPRSTKDIDIFWLDEEGFQQAYAPLRESTQVVTQKYHLDPDWLNYLTQMLLYDEVVVPEGKRWKTFGPLHVYIPTDDYILALKITAGRQKDLEDCAILLPKTKIHTRDRDNIIMLKPSHTLWTNSSGEDNHDL